jgi:hypothetical protein
MQVLVISIFYFQKQVSQKWILGVDKLSESLVSGVKALFLILRVAQPYGQLLSQYLSLISRIKLLHILGLVFLVS